MECFSGSVGSKSVKYRQAKQCRRTQCDVLLSRWTGCNATAALIRRTFAAALSRESTLNLLCRAILPTQQGRIQGGVQGVRAPTLLIRVPFLKRKCVYFFDQNGEWVFTRKYHRECIRTHHFDIKNTKIFWEGHSLLPRPHSPRRLPRLTSGAPFRWIGHLPLQNPRSAPA